MQTSCIDGFRLPPNTFVTEQYVRTEEDGSKTVLAVVVRHITSGIFTLYMKEGNAFVRKATAKEPKFKETAWQEK